MPVYVILMDQRGKPSGFIVDEDEDGDTSPSEFESVADAIEQLKDHTYIKAWGGYVLDFETQEMTYI